MLSSSFPLALVAYALVTVVPGLWVGFSGLPGRLAGATDGWGRLLLSMILAPAVAGAEYLALRALGLGQGAAFWAIALGNLPALLLVWRARAAFAWSGLRAAMESAAALAVPVLFLAVLYGTQAWVDNWGHPSLHVDIIRDLGERPFGPEDQHLAGLQTAYPWFVHLDLLLAQIALGTDPLSVFGITACVMAATYGGFAMLTVAALGGGRAAVLVAPFLAGFALNPVGTLLYDLIYRLHIPVASKAYLLGDPRYDFLLIKHVGINANMAGLTLLAGLAWLAVRPAPPADRRATVLTALLVLVTVLIYPLYLPVALIVTAASGLMWWQPWHRGQGARFAPAACLVGAAVVAAAIGYLLVRLQLGDRASGLGVLLSGPGAIWRKAVQASVALSLPGLACLWMLRRSLVRAPRATAVLVLAALGCAAANALLSIPNYMNEYKYVLAAGYLLVPFLCLAVDRMLAARAVAGQAAVAGLVTICLLGAGVATLRRMENIARNPATLVRNGASFDLAKGEPLAAALQAIRTASSEDAILVAADARMYLPLIAERPLYVPAEPERAPVWTNMGNDYLLLKVMGYPADVVVRRRAILGNLLWGRAQDRAASLNAVESLGRPVVVLVEPRVEPGLEDWLLSRAGGKTLYRDSRYAVIVVDRTARRARQTAN